MAAGNAAWWNWAEIHVMSVPLPLPNEWRPEPKQELFLSIPTTIKEAFYGGGAGSGKSDVLLLYGIVHRWHEHPKFKQVFMREPIQNYEMKLFQEVENYIESLVQH